MIDVILAYLHDVSAFWFLLALGLLPLVGIPASPIWVLSGVTFGVWIGLALAIGGMGINFALAYVISQRWLRKPLTQLFLRRGVGIPQARPGEYIQLTLAIRLMPGLPQFMQGYLLGLADVPFITYFVYSFPPQIAYAVGFVVLGNSLFSLKGGGIFLGICILVAVSLLVNIVRKRRILSARLNQEVP